MGIVGVFANHKGGVGKSTMSITLLEILAKIYNFSVLGVDMDPQANLTESLIGSPLETDRIADCLKDPNRTPFCITPSWHPGIDIIPASLRLEEVAYEMEHNSLRKALEPVRSLYDFIVVDTPPTLGPLLKIALHAGDIVTITCTCGKHAAYGIPGFTNMFQKEFKNVPVEEIPFLLGILITIYDSRVKLENLVRNYLMQKTRIVAETPKIQQLASNVANKKHVFYKTSKKQQEEFLIFAEKFISQAKEIQYLREEKMSQKTEATV